MIPTVYKSYLLTAAVCCLFVPVAIIVHLQLFKIVVSQKSRIEIFIDPELVASQTVVNFFGAARDVISKAEELTFNLTHELLFEAVYQYKQENITGFNLHDPTKFGRLYSNFKWEPVIRYLTPSGFRVLDVESTPMLLKRVELTQGKQITGSNFSVSILAPVTENITVTWENTTGLFTPRTPTGYNVFMGNMPTGVGVVDFWATGLYGKNSTNGVRAMIGNKTDEQVSIGTGQTLAVELKASQVTIVMEIDYEGCLTGYIFCYFDDRVEDHYFWAYSANYLLNKVKEPNIVAGKETVTIEFYRDAEILVKDNATGDTVHSIKLANGRVPQKIVPDPEIVFIPEDKTLETILTVLLILLLIIVAIIIILKLTGKWDPFMVWMNK